MSATSDARRENHQAAYLLFESSSFSEQLILFAIAPATRVKVGCIASSEVAVRPLYAISSIVNVLLVACSMCRDLYMRDYNMYPLYILFVAL